MWPILRRSAAIALPVAICAVAVAMGFLLVPRAPRYDTLSLNILDPAPRVMGSITVFPSIPPSDGRRHFGPEYPEGTPVVVLARGQSWSEVRIAAGHGQGEIGWVPTGDIAAK